MEALKQTDDADLYEEDFCTWTQRQAALIRAGKTHQADLANIAEEIETLGRAEISELRSRYKVSCMHLLKKTLQSEKDGRNWTITITDQRVEIAQNLKDNPGLKSKKEALFLEGYANVRKVAAAEIHLPLDRFPEHPPFTIEEAENEVYWPNAISSEPQGKAEALSGWYGDCRVCESGFGMADPD